MCPVYLGPYLQNQKYLYYDDEECEVLHWVGGPAHWNFVKDAMALHDPFPTIR